MLSKKERAMLSCRPITFLGIDEPKKYPLIEKISQLKPDVSTEIATEQLALVSI